ncbi:hypothetical protein FPZ54_04200 [Sphingomonas suaedae]|uniref:Aspartate-semialdehyde dehydrogenase n=1 Tax=Sphingomonas suaedae TaxID=2599297 RepID=A0A518RCZ7_9SPHN|nr:hypothetical protein [Sphingomonas suaedae]QDX25306.1 hypothetical protein FPZ54_04200 [Sphingomonas suaedae]
MMRFATLPLLAIGAACSPAAPDAAGGNAIDNRVAVPVADSATGNAAVAATPEPQAGPRPLLAIAPGGLSLIDPTSGRARQLEFGVERAIVARGAEAALGKAGATGRNGECGEGAMDFAKFDGLTLWFQDDKFVGWFLDGATPKLTTASGAGIGSTRAQVADALAIRDVPDSSLGREFTTASGSFSGLLEGQGDDAKVTALWSGQACIFR